MESPSFIRLRHGLFYLSIFSILWIIIGVWLLVSSDLLLSDINITSSTMCENIRLGTLYACSKTEVFLLESPFWIFWKFLFLLLGIASFIIGFFRK